MKDQRRLLIGPFAWFALGSAAIWLVAGVIVLAFARPGLWPLVVLALLAGLVLAVMGARTIVTLTADTLTVVGHPPVPAASIVQVGLKRAARWPAVFVPVVVSAQGRALTTLELDGLSSLGEKAARAAATHLAERLGRGPVELLADEPGSKPRRLDG